MGLVSVQKIACPVCGCHYDPAERGACGACPLNPGCQMVCCPNCGHTTIDPSQSRLVQLATKWLAFRRPRQRPLQGKETGQPEPVRSQAIQSADRSEGAKREPATGTGEIRRLAEIQPGERVRVMEYAQDITPARRARLQAYGIVPGYWVEVIQQTPVTVVRVDHLELALENELAERIGVVRSGGGKAN